MHHYFSFYCQQLRVMLFVLMAFAGCEATPAGAEEKNQPDTVLRLPAIEVIGVSPVKGLDQPKREISSSVQSIDQRAVRESGAASLPELMNARLNGVTVNEIQGNPFQVDVNYRGFTVSPLLGTPQGLSVYQDGVRVNEPFGESVNWDLIPRQAIASIDLIPGSNPLFGLNTLGGALSIHTKSGLDAAGSNVETEAGSFGRRTASADFSGKPGAENNLGVFFAASTFREEGWRDFSPSRVDQFFGKLSHYNGPLEMDLAWTHADTDLTGNGLLPDAMLQARHEGVFTKPDRTQNRLDLLSLNTAYWLDDNARLSATLYHRQNRTQTLNGDINNDFEDGLHDMATGGDGLNIDTAANNRTRSTQMSRGGALQWSRLDNDNNNHVAFGITYDASHTTFTQTTALGVFDAQRGVTNATGEVLDNQLIGTTRSGSLFATDTWKPIQEIAMTISLRYNHTQVATHDQGPSAPALDGDFTYTKLNPALGFTWQLDPAITAFASAGQGNRAPSPIELGCADSANPCSLPNAMQSDPYLKQVVTRTLEAGLRGQSDALKWNAAAFTAENHDDILFVGTSTSQGYFTNFGRTRRSGVQLDLSAQHGALDWRVGYSYVNVTYRSSACLLSPNNSARGLDTQCAADEIRVQSGNRLPGIPLHSLKLGADYVFNDRWRLTADAMGYSRQYVRGNENNAHQAGGAFFGSGEAKGYAVLNLGVRMRLEHDWELFGRVNNIFARHYASAGALGQNPFDAAGVFQTHSGQWQHETFYAPGVPRAVYFGFRSTFR